MSKLFQIDAIIYLSFNKEHIEKILKHGLMMGYEYIETKTNQKLTTENAAQLAFDMLDCKWTGGFLGLKIPMEEFPFALFFHPHHDCIRISFSNFDYQAKEPLYYDFIDANYIPYLDLLLDFTKPFILLEISAGQIS